MGRRAGSVLAQAERRAQVARYFAEHPNATYRQAEQALAIPKSTIAHDVEALRAALLARGAETYLATMVQRNEAIIEAFMPLVLRKGSVAHAQTVLAADKRTAELLGLDAPKKAVVELRNLAERAAAQYGLDPAQIVAEAERILAEVD